MRILRVENYEELSKRAAAFLAAEVTTRPDCLLGLATGSTPEGVYRYLAKWYGEGILDFSEVRTVNLDEYKGLSRDHEQSYYHYMEEHLFSKVNIKRENIHLPNGEEDDEEKECQTYTRLLRGLGGADIQILGIGRNGHIGFNEPSDHFEENCHCVALTKSTIEANRRFFEREEDVPRKAYTMGIGMIMSAKKIVLMASGRDKADAISRMIDGPITPELPASVLRLHPDVTIIADDQALSLKNV